MFKLFYGHILSSENTIQQIVEIFQCSDSVKNKRANKYSYSGHSQEYIDLVRASVGEEPLVDVQNKFGLLEPHVTYGRHIMFK